MDIDFPKRAGTNFPYMRPSEGGLFDVARRYTFIPLTDDRAEWKEKRELGRQGEGEIEPKRHHTDFHVWFVQMCCRGIKVWGALRNVMYSVPK